MGQLLVIVSLMIISLILPFTYSFIKNLYTEGYKEYQRLKKQLKENPGHKDLQTAKKLIKSLEDFHRAAIVMIILLFFVCIFSFIFGFSRVANISIRISEENLMFILVCLQVALLIAYLILFGKYKPLGNLKELKKLNLD